MYLTQVYQAVKKKLDVQPLTFALTELFYTAGFWAKINCFPDIKGSSIHKFLIAHFQSLFAISG